MAMLNLFHSDEFFYAFIVYALATIGVIKAWWTAQPCSITDGPCMLSTISLLLFTIN